MRWCDGADRTEDRGGVKPSGRLYENLKHHHMRWGGGLNLEPLQKIIEPLQNDGTAKYLPYPL